MILFGYGASALGRAVVGLLHGLKLVAVAVVAQAVWGMARTSRPTAARGIALLAMIVMALGPNAWPARRDRAGRLRRAIAAADGRRCAAADGRASRPRRMGALPLPFLRGLWCCSSRAGHGAARCSAPSTARARWSSAAGMWCCRCCARGRGTRLGSDGAFLAGYGAGAGRAGPLFTFAAYLGAVAARRPTACWRRAGPGRDLPAGTSHRDGGAAILA